MESTIRNIDGLDPDMQKKVENVCCDCEKHGVPLLVYCTLRSIQEQARVWRSTRTTDQIEDKKDKFIKSGFEFLANVLEDVGPQYGSLGNHKTYAGPGESFHNYGLAWDAVPVVDGKLLWSVDNNYHTWETYGQCIKENELVWAGNWTNFKEYVHCQYIGGGNPLKIYRIDTIKKKLEKFL